MNVYRVLIFVVSLSLSLNSFAINELSSFSNNKRTRNCSKSTFDSTHSRILFVGDSITGYGGRWESDGFPALIQKAIKREHPNANLDVAVLGGSGMGIDSWKGLVDKVDGYKGDEYLDARKTSVKAGLGEHADVLVIMLGMNDVLAPYFGDDDVAIAKWQACYQDVIDALKKRVTPNVIGLATITMCTEDPASPKNRMIDKLNQRVAVLARKNNCRLLPVSESLWEMLCAGRKVDPEFHTTLDFVHPNKLGHLAVAGAMLRGLGELSAADLVEREAKLKVSNSVKSANKNELVQKDVPQWLVAAGLIQNCWVGSEFQADKARTTIDKAIEANEDFTKPINIGGGKNLSWGVYQPSINYIGNGVAGSVDFAAVTQPKTFESGYGAQWIKSPIRRPVNIDLSSSIFAGDIYLTVWLNGNQVYGGQITKEPGKKTMVKAVLQKGWNRLVFKSNHRTWQWQVCINVVSTDNEPLNDLHYSIKKLNEHG